jgi:hypothetical protein
MEQLRAIWRLSSRNSSLSLSTSRIFLIVGLLAGIPAFPPYEAATIPAVDQRRFRVVQRGIPVMLSIHSGDVVHHSGDPKKVDNFPLESLDNFDRNWWTTSNGTGGQLAPEYALGLAQK